jgi:hypothetical protein
MAASAPEAVPGSHQGACAADMPVDSSQSYASSIGPRLIRARDAWGVRQELAHPDHRLAPDRELGPTRGDVCIGVRLVAIDQYELARLLP